MGQRYTINIIVVIVLTFAMYAYLKFSKQGYEISVVGESENTARYAGINVRRVTVRTMLISGAVCGLCGFLIVAGKDQYAADIITGIILFFILGSEFFINYRLILRGAHKEGK